MSFVDAIKSVLTNYVNFNGRARRSEYWYFFLLNIVATIVLNAVGQATGLTIFGTLWSLALFIPGLAVAVRRLHDTGKKWTWILVVFIPVIGAIWLLVMFAGDSQPGDNQFGPNPKA